MSFDCFSLLGSSSSSNGSALAFEKVAEKFIVTEIFTVLLFLATIEVTLPPLLVVAKTFFTSVTRPGLDFA